jgi:hypothetical protein
MSERILSGGEDDLQQRRSSLEGIEAAGVELLGIRGMPDEGEPVMLRGEEWRARRLASEELPATPAPVVEKVEMLCGIDQPLIPHRGVVL